MLEKIVQQHDPHTGDQLNISDNLLGVAQHAKCLANHAKAIKELKRNKSSGADMLTSEHFLYASEKLHVLISLLFNCVNIHGYLLKRLMETIIVPIVKDNKGILTDKNNYRPIALTCVASKLLELLILDICNDTITTSDSQFGFKANYSTAMCISP